MEPKELRQKRLINQIENLAKDHHNWLQTWSLGDTEATRCQNPVEHQ
jgi:hypothetical protein